LVRRSRVAPPGVRQAGRHRPDVVPARCGDYRREHHAEVLEGGHTPYRERRCRAAFPELSGQRVFQRRPDLLRVRLHLGVLVVPDHDDLNPRLVEFVEPVEHLPAFRVQHGPRVDQQHLGTGRRTTVEQCGLVPVQIADVRSVGEAPGQFGGMIRQRADRVLAVRVPLANLFAVVRGVTPLRQVIAAWGDDGHPQQLVTRARSVVAAEGRRKRLVLSPELRSRGRRRVGRFNDPPREQVHRHLVGLTPPAYLHDPVEAVLPVELAEVGGVVLHRARRLGKLAVPLRNPQRGNDRLHRANALGLVVKPAQVEREPLLTAVFALEVSPRIQRHEDMTSR
jgi:hypothetical protein